MKKYILVTVIISVFLIACGKKSKETTKDEKKDTTKVQIAIDSLAFEVDTFHIIGKDEICKEKENCTTCDIYYEKIRTPLKPVHDSVNRYIDTFMVMAFGDLSGNRNLKNIQKIAQDFIEGSHDPEYELNGGWDWQYGTTIVRPVTEIISVNSNYGGYTGGAHGLYYSETANFFTNTAKRVKLSDLFTDMKALNKIGVKYFKKDNELEPDVDLLDQGWDFADADFQLNENFDISMESITWQYNAYEIGPYVMGAPSVTIPMKEIEKLMKVKFTDVVIK